MDFGGGNLGSLVAALRRRGADFVVTSDPDVVADARAAILPGDGAFAATMQALVRADLAAAIDAAIARGATFLGICVGMQLLYERGEENGVHPGLGYFRGTIARFSGAERVPHMGWNELEPLRPHPFTAGLHAGDYAYFLHSYRAGVDAQTLAACSHGERFAAIVARDNVMATQFHPEKSQTVGAHLLDNFLRIAAA